MTSTSKEFKPLISVVIVVWNGKEYLRKCLESLFEKCAGSNLEVIVSDNASTDGAPEMVAQQFPQVKLIRNSDNFGFAKANNIGIHVSNGEYVCLVNSDVEFIENCFPPMTQYLEDHPDIGVLGPKSLTAQGETARSTMRFPTVWNSFCRAFGMDSLLSKAGLVRSQLMDDFDHSETCDVDILNGWFWMIPRAALEQVGLLDEQFFIYGEDLDWCQRFHEHGKRVVFFAGTAAIHFGGASSSAAPLRFSLEMERANWQYFRKHYSVVRRTGFFFAGIFNHGIRAFGYGISCLIPHAGRDQSRLKFRRSLLSLNWLLRFPVFNP